MAQRESDIGARHAVLDLASIRWSAIRPVNDTAFLLRWLDDHCMTLEGVTKDVREVVEDPAAVLGKGISVVQLRGTIEQAVFGGGDLERDAAADWITVDILRVDAASLDVLAVTHAASNGPEVDGVFALVLDDGGPGGNGKWGEGRKGGERWKREPHFQY